jgi:hypothetical protein
MKRWTEDLIGIANLDYIVFKNVPMRESKWGPVIEVREIILEQITLKALVLERIPLHGREVLFIRKALGLTIQEFAEKLRLTHGAIQGWEKKPEARLLPFNEIALRVFLAEEMKIDIFARFSELIGTDTMPKRIELLAS